MNKQLDLFENTISDREYFWFNSHKIGDKIIGLRTHCNEYENDGLNDWTKNTCFGCKYIDKCRKEYE